MFKKRILFFLLVCMVPFFGCEKKSESMDPLEERLKLERTNKNSTAFYIKNETDDIASINEKDIAPNQCALVKASDFPVTSVMYLSGCAPSIFTISKVAHYKLHLPKAGGITKDYSEVVDGVESFVKYCKDAPIQANKSARTSCGSITPASEIK